MRFVKCGSQMFDPKAVTSVQRQYTSGAGRSVLVQTTGGILMFNDDEAEAVWDYFLGLPVNDLMRVEDAHPQADAPNHREKDC